MATLPAAARVEFNQDPPPRNPIESDAPAHPPQKDNRVKFICARIAERPTRSPFPADLAERIDRWAKAMGKDSHSEAMRHLLEIGLSAPKRNGSGFVGRILQWISMTLSWNDRQRRGRRPTCRTGISMKAP